MRQPPSNERAEQAVLGALLTNNKTYFKCHEILKPEHFFDPVNGLIFAAISERVAHGQVADAITLKGEFENSGKLDEVGGVAYLAKLISAMVGMSSVPDYARTISEAWARRRLSEIGADLVDQSFVSHEPFKAATEAFTRLTEAIETQTIKRATSLDEAMDAALLMAQEAYQSGGISGLSTGMKAVDAQMAGGLRPETLTVLGARPGMGKTGIAVQWAVNVAREAKRRNDAAKERVAGGVLIVSLEMSAADLGIRVLSSLSGVPGIQIQTGRLAQRDFDALVKARHELAGLPISIEDAAGQTAADIAIKARVANRKHGLSLVVVDHLQIVKTTDDTSGNTVAVGRISGAMKRLAKDMGIPVVLLAQLSREVERRDDKRPILSDLRYSGDIEADADNVAFLYRPEYYLGSSPPEPKPGERSDQHGDRVDAWTESKRKLAGVAELILAKVRAGATGNVKLTFDGPTTSFSEPTR